MNSPLSRRDDLSLHPIHHGIGVHTGANRGKYNDISSVQLMVIELSPLQKVEHRRQGCHRTVAKP